MSTDAATRCELHMHSTYSDGSATPQALLHHAAEIGLRTVAITDHDNARGARIAVPLAAALGLEFIPAIEFTARWESVCGPETHIDVDVLGYYVDLDDGAFQVREQAALDDIRERLDEACTRLRAQGIAVTLDDALAFNPLFPSVRGLREALIHMGYAHSETESWAVLNPCWEPVRLSRFTVQDQIAAIRAARGVSILAHPGYIRCKERWPSAHDLAPLVEAGLDGLEAVHRAMDANARAYFAGMAAELSLLVTGGSDEHGWSPDLPLMGTAPVTAAMVEALRARGRARWA